MLLLHETEGSATIPNHIDGFRNHLDSLLELENQVEIFESGIIISTFTFFMFSIFLHIMHESLDTQNPLFGKQESQESI